MVAFLDMNITKIALDATLICHFSQICEGETAKTAQKTSRKVRGDRFGVTFSGALSPLRGR
jgi:hypothetical protein